MSECTNIADFRGIRPAKSQAVYTAPQSARTSYGFMVLDSTTAFRQRAGEHLDEPVAMGSQAVYDIGMVREAQRFGHRDTSSAVRDSKVIRFSNAMPRLSQECRGVATWNASCEDPLDCPPAA